MAKRKTLSPSQGEAGSNKKQSTTVKNTNSIQPQTKDETCCSRVILPLDVVAEILSRLPSKSIAKLRCVCKQWLSLTSDLRFLKSQHERSSRYMIIDKQVLYGVIRLRDFSTVEDGDKSTEIFYRFFNLERKQYTLSNCVDGLSCAYAFGCPIKSDLYLLNPMTRELQNIPENNGLQDGFGLESVGVGIDMTKGQYKIVGLFYRESRIYCDIHTLGTTQWRRLGEAPFKFCDIYPVLLHGALHWIGHQEGKRCLFRLNIKDEKFEPAISIPYPSFSDMRLNCLKESGGKLWLAFNNVIEKHFEIWTMKDYVNNTWVKEYKLDRSSLPSLHSTFHLREIVNNDFVLHFWEGKTRHVICYNPRSGAWVKLIKGGIARGDWTIYRESLVSPEKLLKPS